MRINYNYIYKKYVIIVSEKVYFVFTKKSLSAGDLNFRLRGAVEDVINEIAECARQVKGTDIILMFLNGFCGFMYLFRTYVYTRIHYK